MTSSNLLFIESNQRRESEPPLPSTCSHPAVAGGHLLGTSQKVGCQEGKQQPYCPQIKLCLEIALPDLGKRTSRGNGTSRISGSNCSFGSSLQAKPPGTIRSSTESILWGTTTTPSWPCGSGYDTLYAITQIDSVYWFWDAGYLACFSPLGSVDSFPVLCSSKEKRINK